MTHHHHDHHDHHKAKLSHELLGGAIAYEAMKVHHHHQEQAGVHVSHAKAKEVMAGIGGAMLVRAVETKGLDALDHHRGRHNEEEGHHKHHHHHHHHRHD